MAPGICCLYIAFDVRAMAGTQNREIIFSEHRYFSLCEFHSNHITVEK